jgi:hypothetical protein
MLRELESRGLPSVCFAGSIDPKATSVGVTGVAFNQIPATDPTFDKSHLEGVSRGGFVDLCPPTPFWLNCHPGVPDRGGSRESIFAWWAHSV